MSKGTQMRKFRTFKEAAQKIVIKKPWGVEVKSYKAGDPIPAGVEFKIFDANDTAKIEAYADGLDESADYQKERFKEPYYMYNESKKVVENKMVGIISLPVGSKFIDDSFGGKRTLEVVKHGNDDVVHVKEVGTGRKFAYDASTPGGNKKVEKIEEGRIVKESKFPGKVVKLGSLKPRDEFVFAIPGIYDDKIDGPRFDIVKKVDKVLDLVYWYPGGNTKYEHSSPARTEVIPAKYMKESRIAKGYENLTSEERAKHLLSHPTSKYMNDLKSENITERAIRKAVKEMLGKPDKRDPQFITDVNEDCDKVEESYYLKTKDGLYVSMPRPGKYDLTSHKDEAMKFNDGFAASKENSYIRNFMFDPKKRFIDLSTVKEEGEAPAIANTTAEVANPELPLKLKEGYMLKSNSSWGPLYYNKKDREAVENKSNGTVYNSEDEAKQDLKTFDWLILKDIKHDKVEIIKESEEI